ncbi:MAG: DoxX family protein [Marinoscillum sp.]
MKKRDKIIYWIATIWLALGMTSTGIVQVIGLEEENEMILGLGYPDYIPMVLGVWKLLGVVAVLAPRFPLLKEWAYAGFFFNMSGAIISHLVVGGAEFADLFGPSLLIVLTMTSWYFRPPSRKLIATV